MATVHIQNHRSPLPWIVGLLVSLLLLWGLWEFVGNFAVSVVEKTVQPVETPAPPVDMAVRTGSVVTPTPMPPTEADDTPIAVSTILMGPSDYVARRVAGTARVTEIVRDEGFWIEESGRRMFAVLARDPENMQQALNVSAGEQVRLSGVVHDASMVNRIEGGLPTRTQDLISRQPAFLLVAPRNVSVVSEAAAYAW